MGARRRGPATRGPRLYQAGHQNGKLSVITYIEQATMEGGECMHIIVPLILGFLTAQDPQPIPLPAPMPSPAYILIAPGVLAEADVAKGNSAYYACLGNPATNKSFVCEFQRSKAI